MEEVEFRISLHLSLQRALLGEVYPSIRAVAYESDDLKRLKIIYYLDREPNDMDYESLSDVCGEVLADLNFEKVEQICEYTLKPFSTLAGNSNLVYRRKEYQQ